MQKRFTRRQVEKITGLTYRLTQYYTDDTGVVVPAKKGSGRGSPHYFDLNNLFQFRILKELAAYGLSLRSCRFIVQRGLQDFDFEEEAQSDSVIAIHLNDQGGVEVHIDRTRKAKKRLFTALKMLDERGSTILLSTRFVVNDVKRQL